MQVNDRVSCGHSRRRHLARVSRRERATAPVTVRDVRERIRDRIRYRIEDRVQGRIRDRSRRNARARKIRHARATALRRRKLRRDVADTPALSNKSPIEIASRR